MTRMIPTTRWTLAAAALLAALAAPAARAVSPSTEEDVRSYMYLSKMKPMDVMHMIDTDKKGYVTREEFLEFQRKLFDRMDQNKDGKVDANEWMGKPPAAAKK
jgi:hypothetical protein